MKWENKDLGRLPIRSWCAQVEKDALAQAVNLANHPRVVGHVALMPDCHVGYGMPIGGVVACENAIIPNAVGVDIGCGMCAVQTGIATEQVIHGSIQRCVDALQHRIPLGEGHSHRSPQQWDDLGELPDWMDEHTRELAHRNLGSLGGGNHFIELQAGDDDRLWMMLHSGSRNLGYRIAEHHHSIAIRQHPELGDLAYLDTESEEGQAYMHEMHLAMAYARENRDRMMRVFKEVVNDVFGKVEFLKEINIHHNYAALEEHFGRLVWVHRKGATSARAGEEGVVPGSMGTASYIVRGRGDPDSFYSCPHGAGRRMGRMAASRELNRGECDRAMKGIVHSGWHEMRGRGRKARGMLDLSEAPQAYKDIEAVMHASSDLAEPRVRLRPLGVVKG